jgi:hypothetical protein
LEPVSNEIKNLRAGSVELKKLGLMDWPSTSNTFLTNFAKSIAKPSNATAVDDPK